MSYPLVSTLAAGKIPVAVTGRFLGFSKQGLYTWRKNPGHNGIGMMRT